MASPPPLSKVLPVSNLIPPGLTPACSISRTQSTPRYQPPFDLPASLKIPKGSFSSHPD